MYYLCHARSSILVGKKLSTSSATTQKTLMSVGKFVSRDSKKSDVVKKRTTQHITTKESRKMTPLIVITLIVLSECAYRVSFGFHPKVCQKIRGHKIAKMSNLAICNKETYDLTKADVTISVNNYAEETSDAVLMYHYDVQCVVNR